MNQGYAGTDEDARLAGLMRAAQDGDHAAYQAVLRACVPQAAATARRQGVPPGCHRRRGAGGVAHHPSRLVHL